jgi:arsenite-transporting ATPase
VKLAELFAKRAVLVTGKGGVGKTTLAATLARAAASQGKRVLCAEVAAEGETDSPLARALGYEGPVGPEPVRVTGGIQFCLLTPTAGHRRFLEDTLKARLLVNAALKAKAIRAFLLAAPTFAEMGVLYRFLDLVRQTRRDGSPEHELLIVDLPATGHALAFARFPAALLKMVPSGPVGAALREGLALVTDPERTAAVVVTLPEQLPVSESIELTRGLLEADLPVAGLVVNRVAADPFVGEERHLVDRFLSEHGPHLGGRTLERIDAARTALKRLTHELSLPLLTLEESLEAGMAAPVDLARSLLGEGDPEPVAP